MSDVSSAVHEHLYALVTGQRRWDSGRSHGSWNTRTRHRHNIRVMQSLRTRKPLEPQKPHRNPSKLSKQNSSASAKDVRKSRVDDRIKKRMSMRYADISGPTNASVPPMPTVPMSLRPGVIGTVKEEVQSDDGASKKEKEKYEDPRIADRKMLDKEDFDPDACEWSSIVRTIAYIFEQISSSNWPTRQSRSSGHYSPPCDLPKTT